MLSGKRNPLSESARGCFDEQCNATKLKTHNIVLPEPVISHAVCCITAELSSAGRLVIGYTYIIECIVEGYIVGSWRPRAAALSPSPVYWIYGRFESCTFLLLLLFGLHPNIAPS
ncbi:hypothetical protein ACJJTC_014769 [Scirpophaga incertulas]